MASAGQIPNLIDIAAVAEHLDVEVRLVHDRRIPFIKWGNLLRFDPEDLRVWLERCRNEPRRLASSAGRVFGPLYPRRRGVVRSAIGRTGSGRGVVPSVDAEAAALQALSHKRKNGL